MKEYSLRRRFDTKHGAKYARFSLREKHKNVQQLKSRLQSQKIKFTHKKFKPKNAAAVKAIFILAEEITQASKH